MFHTASEMGNTDTLKNNILILFKSQCQILKML